MKKSSGNNSLLFLAFIAGVLIVGILPGFIFFRWGMQASWGVSLLCGALAGYFGWMTLNFVMGVISFFLKKLREAKRP